MNEILVLNFHYFSNFPIKSNYINKNFSFFKFKTSYKFSKKKFCKNFFLILLFLKFFKNKIFLKNNLVMKYNFLTKPNTQNIYNYLRAPYKNKLARNQLCIPRYKFGIKIKLFTKFLHTHMNTYHYLLVLNFFKKNLVGVESNIFYLNKVNIKYSAHLTNFWNYNKIVK